MPAPSAADFNPAFRRFIVLSGYQEGAYTVVCRSCARVAFWAHLRKLTEPIGLRFPRAQCEGIDIPVTKSRETSIPGGRTGRLNAVSSTLLIGMEDVVV